MSHICKEYLAEVAVTTIYKEINAGLLYNKVVNKNYFFKVYTFLHTSAIQLHSIY